MQRNFLRSCASPLPGLDRAHLTPALFLYISKTGAAPSGRPCFDLLYFKIRRASQCPAPTKKKEPLPVCRRSGYPHPPAPKVFSPFVGRGLLDAPFHRFPLCRLCLSAHAAKELSTSVLAYSVSASLCAAFRLYGRSRIFYFRISIRPKPYSPIPARRNTQGTCWSSHAAMLIQGMFPTEIPTP